MGRYKLLKDAYIEGTARKGDEVEVPESEVPLLIANGVIEGPKSKAAKADEPQPVELPEGDMLSPMQADEIIETEEARVVPEEERKSSSRKGK
jgi:hypothetical protein